MAEAVVTIALETIRDLLIEEGRFLFGVRNKVKELQGELEALQSFLKDAIARRHEHESVRTWVSQAKRLAYRAEDIIEEYAIKVASKRGGGLTKVAKRAAHIVGEGVTTHIVGNEIGKINTEIANLTKTLATYGINQIIEAQPSSEKIDKQRRLRVTYAHQVDKYFVGMEDDFSKIVTWVTVDDMIHRVISICGIGGLGKTTIARKVFNHIEKSSERSFECFAWVSVTQQCQVKMLIQDILNQILGYKIGDLEETELVRKLYDVLKNKKCFVVLDDIWELDDWRSLSPAIPISEGSSKILFTTRKTEVAEVAEQDSRHEPKLLDEEDGWDLLTKIALNLQEDQGNTLPETIMIVGKDMLHKCGGLPLTISALGGILRHKDPLTEWEMVNETFGTYLGGDGRVASVLTLSYDDLPSYLRPCFLYMGCFKEDEEIDTTHLYQLWMAEGFIPTRQTRPKETLMDVASDFLHELISRNVVQPIVISKRTNNECCRLHDLMRDLCLTKGIEEEFMEVKSIQIHGEEVGSICIDGVGLCRQAILVGSRDRCKVSIAKLTGETCFRALIFRHECYGFVEGAMKFKRLRSLILDGSRFKDDEVPKEIRDMIHLRYLSLRKTIENGKLPTFIGELQYLQSLNVSHNNIEVPPNIFQKMKRLRFLYHSEERLLKGVKRLEFHGLNELEVVEGLNSRYDKVTHLSELVNLRRLIARIWGYEDLSTILGQLSSLLKLQYVSITFNAETSESELEKGFPDVKMLLLCPSLRCLHVNAPIGNFPRYEHQFWPDLVSIELWYTKFEEDPMPFLQELPNLRELGMKQDAYVGKEMYCSSKAFPKLTSLVIKVFPNIEIWRVDAGAFPVLTSLDIWDMPKMKIWRVDDGAFPELTSLRIFGCMSFEEIVPDGLTSITTLTEIDMFYVPQAFTNRFGRVHNHTNQSLLTDSTIMVNSGTSTPEEKS